MDDCCNIFQCSNILPSLYELKQLCLSDHNCEEEMNRLQVFQYGEKQSQWHRALQNFRGAFVKDRCHFHIGEKGSQYKFPYCSPFQSCRSERSHLHKLFLNLLWIKNRI